MRNKLILRFVIVLAIIAVGVLATNNSDNTPFNSEQWKNCTESESDLSLRWNRIQSLKEKHELKGKTKEGVFKLLGEPLHQINNKFYYYLGMSGFGINTGTLFIEFDEDYTVKDFKVWDG
ncbi:hypothetical protein ES677_13600 [Bizionia gelidisalsuginis]|uniref:Outer membrane protein assembly factor BamE n=2 Tax=Bizionia TaxID=283785 RepID=A0A8H2LF51_9FLAO|nr:MULTISPECIES: hypothetical protein [Bizionia]TYB69497.1 hypothetical protein ES676_13830 [Bizionia saleffrena]TYC09133.1 hypothetical protein ES677_13600 [Bizionia gelidisalsuginis]